MVRTPSPEMKFQRYRAVVVFKNTKEGHIVFGPSLAWVQENYDEAFLNLYGPDSDENQLAYCKEIQIQKWDGQADAGRWTLVKTFMVPQPISMPIAIRRKEPLPTTPMPV